MRPFLAGIFIVCSLTVSNIAFAEEVEDKLKVAYLVNIANFIKWPDEPSEVGLCVSASSRLFPILQKLNKYRLDKGKTLVLKVDPASMTSCHIAFSDDTSDIHFTEQVLSTNPNVLSISDTSRALRKGYTFQLFVRNLHLRFAINRAVVDEANFKVSSKLLRLSRQLD